MYVSCPDGSALFVVDSGTMLAAAASDAVGVGPSEAVVSHDASVSEYEPASTFGGVRPGWVFCTRDGLTGYFKDANPFTTWSPAPAAPISSGSAAGTTPVARSRRFLLRLVDGETRHRIVLQRARKFWSASLASRTPVNRA